MADISWSAYALAMFTPEQRAAAVAATYEPPDTRIVLPPDYTPKPPGSPTSRVTINGVSYDPNTPAQLKLIHEAGYRFINGQWYPPSVLGQPVNPEAQTGGRVGIASVPSATTIGGGAVLGYTVPVAPAVLLPSFVGGRIGRVSIGEGLRPESGGGERVRFGRFAQVRGLCI